ncbi:hypothetical protein [Alteromonas sp. CYL-A6]|uniref:hypothetical protein n=1 Tax=Alteromonas nitratireducens TaxID=3390813 RepID=UPI0034C2ACD8
MSLTRVMFFVLAMALTACTTLPTNEQIDQADYGPYPENYEQIVKAFYDDSTGKKDATQYNAIHKPTRYWLGNELDGIYYGYLVCTTVNTQNMFGRYTGFRHDALLINNGSVIKAVEGATWWGKPLCPPA